jgi:hypothetical protein
MLTLTRYLEEKRVSELQEFYAFWGPGDPPPADKAGLKTALLAMLTDEEIVQKRLRVLSKAPMQLLLVLIRSEDFRADVQSVFYNEQGIVLEHYEVEASARALARRGFIEISRNRNWINYGREVYEVPRELGETVALLLSEERRGPREVFSLAGHLKAKSPQRLRALLRRHGHEGNGGTSAAATVGYLIGTRGARAMIAGLENDRLRELLDRLIADHGGILARTKYEQNPDVPLKWDRKRWQKYLETAGLGTLSNLSLDDFGIRLEGESIVVFHEVVESWFGGASVPEAEFERVAAARIDLLTDLAHFLRFIARNPVRVTQGQRLYRAAHLRVLEGLVFRETALVDRDEILSLIWDIAHGLALVAPDEERILRLTRAGEAWEGRDLLGQVRQIYEWFLKERSPEGRDFHMKKLRRLLCGRLRDSGAAGWRPFLELPFLARNDYLATLEEEGIRERFKNHFQYSYDPPRTTLAFLAADLAEWLVKRMFVLGFVDIGLARDRPLGVRLTDLGLEVLGVDVGAPPANGSSPLVVNPDFEVLVFPEGNVLPVVHTLDRFAVRTQSEEVSRYRIDKDGVERAVSKGMSAEAILAFLSEHSRNPIPQNVEYSIRDWGEKIAFATQREIVLLRVDSETVLDRVLALPGVRDMVVERISPTAAALREMIRDWKTLEEMRVLGVYIRG